MEKDINDVVKIFINWLRKSGCYSFKVERAPVVGTYYLTPFNTVTKRLIHEQEILATEEEFRRIKKATKKQLFAVCLYFDPSVKDVSYIIRAVSISLNITSSESIGLCTTSFLEGAVRLKIGCWEITNTLYHQLLELGVPVTFEPFEE